MAHGAQCLSRRAFLVGLPSFAAAPKGNTFPSERKRYTDSATDNEVLRLTGESTASFLPPPYNRAASSKGGFLVYVSDRTGTLQAFRLDLRSGESKLLTEAGQLNLETVTLTGDEKAICFFDGLSLRTAALSNLRDREIYRATAETRGLSVSEDGANLTFIEGRKLMLASMKGGAQPVVDVSAEASIPLIRPKRAGILYRAGSDSLWLASFDGSENRKLKTTGPIQLFEWSPDGRTVLYLSGNDLREHTPDNNADALVAKTSQFVSFGRNSDASVFVGASGSKAGPYVLLLLRIARRELALCEHRSSDPSKVNPIFSPSSQRIYFQSDRDGKMAIYTMAVDRFVEKTET